MGTNIHAFLEFDESGSSAPFPAPEHTWFLSYGELFIWRRPLLFQSMGCPKPDGSPGSGGPHPRGLPDNISYAVSAKYYCIVQERKYRDEQYDLPPDCRFVVQKEIAADLAEEWLARGLLILAPPGKNMEGRPARRRVSNPDWHSASWMSLPEFRAAIDGERGRPRSRSLVDLEVIACAMEQFERGLGAGRTRLVYWFDNRGGWGDYEHQPRA